jgi:pimeloyl-ACP methyl ester carboxylesterase
MYRAAKWSMLFVLLLIVALTACTPTATPALPTPTREYKQVPIPMTTVNGKFDVGGHNLYLECYGEGSPTVVLENGWGDNLAGAWYRIIPNIALVTRVCGYERANMGMSDSISGTRTTQQLVVDLHALLQAAKIEGPYILTGHSFGGYTVRLYASQYPNDVAGVVLVDSRHPDIMTRWLAALPKPSPNDTPEVLALRQNLPTTSTDPVPPEQVDLQTSDAQIRAVKSLGSIPLVVLARAPNGGDVRSTWWSGLPNDIVTILEQGWQEAQKDLTSLSSNSTLIVAAKSGHYIQDDEPQLVIDAILDLVDKARQK